MNIEKLASTLAEGEAYLITSTENCFYFTGFQNGEGVLLITPKERVYMTDGRYIEAVRARIACCTDILDAPVFTDEIERICSFEGIKTLFVESGRITLGFYEKLRSRRNANIASLIFLENVRSDVKKKFFATCCVIVDAPVNLVLNPSIRIPLFKLARIIPWTSIPG